MVSPVRVTVLTPLGRDGQGGIDRLMDSLRPVFGPGADSEIVADFVTSRGPRLATMPLYFALAWIRVLLRGLLGRHDVVHINLASHASTWRKIGLAAAARLGRTPYVLHLHGGLFDHYVASCGPSMRAAIRWLFDGAARVIVLGSTWRDVVASVAPAAADRIDIVPNGSPTVPPSAPRPAGRPVEFLYLGRLEPRKGLPELLGALTALAGRADWTATLAGDGAVVETKGELRDRGLADRVTVTGWLSTAEAAAALSRADVLVLPSRGENLPMSIIEAFAAGVPAIATPVGAIADIVRPDETGWLVPVGDVAALTRALVDGLDHAERRAAFGAAARRLHAESLSLDAYRSRLAAVWRAAAQAGSTSTRVVSVSPAPSVAVATIIGAGSRAEKAAE